MSVILNCIGATYKGYASKYEYNNNYSDYKVCLFYLLGTVTWRRFFVMTKKEF